jgi:hypothetical protein
LIGTGAINPASQGYGVSLTSDGSLLAVSGINDNSIGAFWIFQRNSSNVWSQLGLKVQGQGNSTLFGYSISFNGNGSFLAVSTQSTTPNSGFGFVYQNVSNIYEFYQNIGPSTSSIFNTEQYGSSISLDSIGNNLVIGTPSTYINSNGSTEVFTKCY